MGQTPAKATTLTVVDRLVRIESLALSHRPFIVEEPAKLTVGLTAPPTADLRISLAVSGLEGKVDHESQPTVRAGSQTAEISLLPHGIGSGQLEVVVRSVELSEAGVPTPVVDRKTIDFRVVSGVPLAIESLSCSPAVIGVGQAIASTTL